MRKKILVIIILISIFFSIFTNNIQAKEASSDISLYLSHGNDMGGQPDVNKQDILKTLRENYDYTGDLTKEIRIDTTVTILEDGSNPKIKIGNIERIVSKKELVEKYGFDESWGDNTKTWKITLVADVPESDKFTTSLAYGNMIVYQIKAKKIYSYLKDEDAPNLNLNQENVDWKDIKSPERTTSEDLSKIGSAAIDKGKDIATLLAELGKDALGVFLKILSRGIRYLADSLQGEMNKLCIIKDGVSEESESKVMYSYTELTGGENEFNFSVLDKYTRVADSGGKLSWQKEITVKNDEETEGFERNQDEDSINRIVNEETKIPVIPTDIYGMAMGKIDVLSTNFIKDSDDEKTNDFWKYLKDKFSLMVHITLYLSVAILLSTLIYHGICIVFGTFDPAKRVEHIEGIKRFAISLIIIIGTILFMEICAYGSRVFLEKEEMYTNGKLTDEMPIRVEVNKVFSFSTNATGYFRFMAISNSSSAQFIYTLTYTILVLFNFIFLIGMFLRMLAMWILGMVGPILATTRALNLEKKLSFNYEKWIKVYFGLAMMQVILAIAYKIILEVAIISNK